MAIPQLAAIGVREVAKFTIKYGIPAAKEAYKAYLKKNPAVRKKIKGSLENITKDFFSKKSITNAGSKFKEAASKTKTSARKTNTPRPPKKDPKKDTTKDTSKTEKPDVKKSRAQKAFDRGAKMTQAERNALVRKRAGQAIGITGVGVGVSEAVKSIQSSKAKAEDKARAKAEADAKRKKELKQKQKDRANQRMNQANPNVQTSVRSGGFEAKRDKPVLGSSKNIRYGSGRGTTTFEDKDKNVVRDRFGKAVKSKSGKVRTRDIFKSSVFMKGGMTMKKKMMAGGGTMKKKGYAAGGVMKKKMMAAGGNMKKKMMAAGGNMKKKMMQVGGALKSPTADQTGLKKLPKSVRNTMGYLKKGGAVKKKMMGGGMSKKKGYAAGGMGMKKGYAAGGRATMKRSTTRGK
tara:strand:+ start:869 stop:2080 length:1212 start_codon:yes stop_codon:yes gene_type:complete